MSTSVLKGSENYPQLESDESKRFGNQRDMPNYAKRQYDDSRHFNHNDATG
jgi:hypothetical protein